MQPKSADGSDRFDRSPLGNLRSLPCLVLVRETRIELRIVRQRDLGELALVVLDQLLDLLFFAHLELLWFGFKIDLIKRKN